MQPQTKLRFLTLVLLIAPLSAFGQDVSSYRVTSGEAEIAGEVHAESNSSADTVVIIVGGSRVTTREEPLQAVPLFLSPNVAVAVHDRRGSGESTGSFVMPSIETSESRVKELAADIGSIAAYLEERGFSRVGVAGSSFGAWVAVAASAEAASIDFLLAFSGAASSVGVSDAFDLATDKGKTMEEAEELAKRYDGAKGYDPAEDLRKMRQPGMWIMGLQDSSNPTRIDAEILQELAVSGKDFKVLLVDDANHEFVRPSTGAFNGTWIPAATEFLQSAGRSGDTTE